jgi:S1-C subfamily serine protease
MSKNFFIYFILSFISVLPLQNLAQQELNPEQIYEKVNDAVVIVLAYDSDGELRNQGSGVVMSSEGYIFTNYHLMKNASSVMVVHGDMSINEVEIIGGNIEADVLALRIPKGNFSFIELPESDEIRIGQRVYAIGSPMGYENTISEGIISGYRKFDKGPNLIQITASISPGSSGGAVVNSRGELIGISTYTVAEGQNINFAIPIKDIMEVEIKPFVISEDEINEETVEVEEHETFKYPDYKIEFNYDPKAIEHLKKGKELIRKSHTQDDKKNEVICLK